MASFLMMAAELSAELSMLMFVNPLVVMPQDFEQTSVLSSDSGGYEAES